MATIAGPSIQMPGSLTDMFDYDDNGKPIAMKPAWAGLFHGLQATAFNATRSGPKTSRPTSNLDGRWIGMPFFDTTLGFTVHLKSTNPDVWVNGAGAAV